MESAGFMVADGREKGPTLAWPPPSLRNGSAQKDPSPSTASSPMVVGGDVGTGTAQGAQTAGAGFARGAAAYLGPVPRVVSDMSTIFYLISFDCGLGGGPVATPEVGGEREVIN